MILPQPKDWGCSQNWLCHATQLLQAAVLMAARGLRSQSKIAAAGEPTPIGFSEGAVHEWLTERLATEERPTGWGAGG